MAETLPPFWFLGLVKCIVGYFISSAMIDGSCLTSVGQLNRKPCDIPSPVYELCGRPEAYTNEAKE